MSTIRRPPLPNEPFAEKRQYSREGLSIRAAQNDEDIERVYRLIHDAYHEKGYCEEQKNRRLTYFEQLDRIPQTTTLLAYLDDEFVGTLSLTTHNQVGMPVDDVFQHHYEQLLNEAQLTSVIWRLAVAKPYRDMPFIVVELIKRTLWRCFELGVDSSVSTIHQRQERLYKRLFNMRAIGHADGISDFSHVPCSFMRWDRERCPARWHPQQAA